MHVIKKLHQQQKTL